MSERDDNPPSGEDTLAGTASTESRHGTLRLLSASARPLRSLADAATFAANPGVAADVFGMTHPGKVRENNQDHFLIACLERSLLVEGSSLPAESGTRLTDTPQGRMLVVADGIGGHGGGELASAVAIDAMAHYAFETMPWVLRRSNDGLEELSEGLQEAMRKAQERVRRVARRKAVNEDLGTTLTMAYITWPDLYVVHVGDSRAYLFRDNELHRLTHDHTLAQRLVEGKTMTEEEAARSHLSHVLVNAVGGRSDALDVELHRTTLQFDDHLLLCTDGLYDLVADDRIAQALGKTEASVETVVTGLIDAANTAGGRDNITVVLARF